MLNMAKGAGGTRPLSPISKAYTNRQNEFNSLMQSGKYSDGYFSEGKGGYYVVENSKFKHKSEEFEAAKFLADGGYKVTLIKEEGTAFRVKTPDGKIFSATFEQRTPEGAPIKKALDHAMEKKAQICVIYDKYNSYHRNDISGGIEKFEKYETYRFDRIIVIESKGKIHIHKHNN